MRWPWQKRRDQPRHALPRQAASWAEPAFPPTAATAAPPPSAPAPSPSPAASPAPAVDVPVQATGVRLGFSDGSEVALDERDPHAVALLAVASVLSQRGGRR